MNNNKFALLSENEASNITGGGVACWALTGASMLSFGLQCFHIYAISVVAMEFYC
jgi:hypothetical protein